VTGQSPAVNHVLWPFEYRLWQEGSKGSYHEVLEDSVRNGTNTLRDRDGLCPFLLPFLKIVVNSMLAEYN
jgi:hypothetical protein